jgi:hypothetical protein
VHHLRGILLNNVGKRLRSGAEIQIDHRNLNFDVAGANPSNFPYWVLVMNGSAFEKICQWNQSCSYHVVGLLPWGLGTTRYTCDGSVVIEQNYLQVLFLEVVDHFCIE